MQMIRCTEGDHAPALRALLLAGGFKNAVQVVPVFRGDPGADAAE